jgi:outer membrane protein assembly factor BamB
MKKIRTVLLFSLFVVTMGAIGLHIFGGSGSVFSSTVVSSDSKQGLYRKTAEISLGKVEVQNYQRMGFTKGFIQFSPDNRALAMGTDNGELLMFSAQGKLLWRKNLGLGTISALEFSRDNRHLLIGETSQEGWLLCLDVHDGREIWRRASVNELGVGIKDKTYPGIVSIKTDQSGKIYAAGLRYIRFSDGHNEYKSRIYQFDADGNRLAMFPEQENMDAWAGWVSVDEAGDRVYFGTANWDNRKVLKYTDILYCLDGQLKKVLWTQKPDVVYPYDTVTMRCSPEVTADGSLVAGVASDGRCFLYDGTQGQLLWQRTVSLPQKIGGVYMNTSGNYLKTVGSEFLFTTGNTYNRANWQLPTPIEHPSSNSLFVFDQTGQLVNRLKFGGMIEQLVVNEQHAVLAIGRNVRTKDPSIHGLYIVSLPDAVLQDSVATTGPCVGVAISPNGRYVAGVEAPLQLDDGQVIGEYKLVLLERK